LTLQWTAPGDDGLSGRASRYDLRYSANAISESNFDQATPSATITSPTLSGYTETMRIEGLNPNTTYFVGLNVFDDAGNTSGLISVSGNTLAGENANPGDVIINELIWKGTSVSVYDEWIELRNRTDRVIDLSGWQLTKYLTDTTDVVMYTLPVGAVIQPQGYLVISEFDAVHSALKNEPDLVNGLGNSNDGTFGLSDTNLRIRLLTGTGTLMDIAWDGGAPPALYHQTGVYNSSMERMEAPGNGFERMRWYPCIDEASISEFFDGTGIDFGTPGVKNRSENEPLLYEFFKKATASATLDSSMETDATVAGTMTTTSAVELTYNQKSHTVSFSVTNVQSYVSLSWELAYDIDPSTDSGLQQGVVGKTDVSSLNTYEKTDILLGTCSTGGSCVYHTGVKNIKLNIILKDESGKETVLEKTLENIL